VYGFKVSRADGLRKSSVQSRGRGWMNTLRASILHSSFAQSINEHDIAYIKRRTS
jgi:hypothetical protein